MMIAIFLIALIFIVGFYLLGCYLLARKFLALPRVVVAPPEWVRITSIHTETGICPAWETPNITEAEAVLIMVYGLKSNLGDWAEEMKEYPPHGVAAIAVELPGQGASPEPRIGYGPAEAKVVAAVAAYVKQVNPTAKITVYGFSMGGAAAWMATELRPDLFDAVITEAAFAQLGPAISDYLDQRIPGLHYLVLPMIWMASRMLGVDIQGVRPVDSASKWKGRQALVIHDGDDGMFAAWHADDLAKASGAEIWEAEGAQHAGAYRTCPDELIKRVVAVAKK